MDTHTDPTIPLDLDAYFVRIGYSGDRRPTLEMLREVHHAHAMHIPFENLDILLGPPIRLDLASLQIKLIHDHRGGYCFEQNTFFAAILEQLGFRVTRLLARVRLKTTRLLPRTHMLLRVECEGGSWIADVGFGTGGIVQPIPLATEQVTRQNPWGYRLMEENGLWVLQSRRGGEWQDLYAFTLEPQHAVDFEVANHFVSTHPDSRFVRTLAVQRSTPNTRYILRDGEYIIDTGDTMHTRTVTDEELSALLAETFGLVFPAGTRFHSQAERLRRALGMTLEEG